MLSIRFVVLSLEGMNVNNKLSEGSKSTAKIFSLFRRVFGWLAVMTRFGLDADWNKK